MCSGRFYTSTLQCATNFNITCFINIHGFKDFQGLVATMYMWVVWGVLWALTAGFGAEPWLPKGISTIDSTADGLSWRYDRRVVLLIAEHKRNCIILFPFNLESIIVHLVTPNGVLVYETKFTVEKSKEMVFIAGKRRVRWWGGSSTLWGEFPKRWNTALWQWWGDVAGDWNSASSDYIVYHHHQHHQLTRPRHHGDVWRHSWRLIISQWAWPVSRLRLRQWYRPSTTRTTPAWNWSVWNWPPWSTISLTYQLNASPLHGI